MSSVLPDRVFWWAFAVCSLVAVLPLWRVEYLPMADLPQHAVQVSIWRHWSDPAFGIDGATYREIYRPNWFTPYLLGYSLARAFAFLLPVKLALKTVLSLALIGVPAAMLAVLRENGGVNPAEANADGGLMLRLLAELGYR